ncbi:choline ABC transporter substrate-binding protein [Aureimonas pseudogalii]|uniref:Glycine betaine/proline transport system substrate-binding protein n=1 Tax=Aureimonas pseudogalii TaxID=1744844 RepID=A0A7W6MKK8_9HYPH|nr:choline ABC transporter substrate-binding protein [Aureimonas pseudogalii]MBB3999040.1 glycine betaine/proline transport system substrate-binding protein [Aureimonas pseudogalii]
MARFASALLAAAAASTLLVSAALAADPASCKTVKMSDPGWSDITSTNALASTVLEGLGYEADVETLAVPIGYQSLANKQIDVFLGNWMPAQQKFRDELDAKKSADVLTKNLEGAKFTLAVPNYVAEAGVKDVKDLAANAGKFKKEIYGIEPGAPANLNIQSMIDAPDYGLKGWKLVDSSEQGMLSQVQKAGRSKDWIVFLGWAPHPMNNMGLTYLSGADQFFGPNYGGAEVFTLARAGYAGECPNVAKLFEQVKFTVPMENEMMAALADGTDAKKAAKDWLKANPAVLEPWLAGVTTLDGQPGLEAVKSEIGG